MFTKDSYQPCAALSPFIDQIIHLKSAEAISYHTLPQTSMVMAFHYQNRMFVKEGNVERQLVSSGLFGLHNAYKVFRNEPDVAMILVPFTATGAHAFFDFPMHELFCHSYPLNQVLPDRDVQRIEEQIMEAITIEDKVHAVEAFLYARLQDRKEDLIIREAVQQIKASGGTVRIKDLANSLYISESRLEKRFRSIVGASPKKFASIVRVRQIITAHQQHCSFTKAAYDAGYFDQAHFIRDFKAFTGVTPNRFFKSGNGPIPGFLPF